MGKTFLGKINLRKLNKTRGGGSEITVVLREERGGLSIISCIQPRGEGGQEGCGMRAATVQGVQLRVGSGTSFIDQQGWW